MRERVRGQNDRSSGTGCKVREAGRRRLVERGSGAFRTAAFSANTVGADRGGRRSWRRRDSVRRPSSQEREAQPHVGGNSCDAVKGCHGRYHRAGLPGMPAEKNSPLKSIGELLIALGRPTFGAHSGGLAATMKRRGTLPISAWQSRKSSVILGGVRPWNCSMRAIYQTRTRALIASLPMVETTRREFKSVRLAFSTSRKMDAAAAMASAPAGSARRCSRALNVSRSATRRACAGVMRRRREAVAMRPDRRLASHGLDRRKARCGRCTADRHSCPRGTVPRRMKPPAAGNRIEPSPNI